MVVEEINGVKVTSIKHAHELLYAEDQPEFITIQCDGAPRPIVIPSAKVAEANKRIMQANGIYLPFYLETPRPDSR